MVPVLTNGGDLRSQGLVKQFFNEKEVTSTLVMDALYSGCKQIEEHSRQYMEVSGIAGPGMLIGIQGIVSASGAWKLEAPRRAHPTGSLSASPG